jgi:hypothetical protein
MLKNVSPFSTVAVFSSMGATWGGEAEAGGVGVVGIGAFGEAIAVGSGEERDSGACAGAALGGSTVAAAGGAGLDSVAFLSGGQRLSCDGVTDRPHSVDMSLETMPAG